MAAPIYRRTRDTFLWVLAVPLLLGALSFWSASRYRDSMAWTQHTQRVLLAVKDVLITVGESRSAQRGFLLSGQAVYLERYTRAAEQTSAQLTDLRTLTADNQRQQSNIGRLAQAVKTHTAEMERVLALRNQGRLPTPDALAALSRESETMAAIRTAADTMRTEEDRLLAERTKRQTNFEIELTLTFVFGIATTVLLLFFAWKLIGQYAEQRDLAEQEIRALNEDLQSRIEERTADLKEANERLSRSNRDLTQFAYVASHDLQEPLRTVGSYAGLLGRRYEGKLDEQADKYIRFIVDGAKRMQTLVQDLLAYSRVGTQSFNLELTDFSALLQQVRDNLRLVIAERGAVVTADSLPAVICDGTKMLQVLQNLVANAIKFRKPDEPPRIHVRARLDHLEYVFSVTDNGIGFDPKYAERIFVIFQRLHQIGAYPGNGIGLAICQRVVEAHDGRIWAESQPGVGSTFFFTLPATLKSRRALPAEASGVQSSRAPSAPKPRDHDQAHANTANRR